MRIKAIPLLLVILVTVLAGWILVTVGSENQLPKSYFVSLPATPLSDKGKCVMFVDRNPVKTDIWTWAQNRAASAGLGRIPLGMQPGYAATLQDSCTEGNASDYSLAEPSMTASDEKNSANVAVGNASIFIAVNQPPVEYIPYWSMKMPFGSNPVKWAAQDPYGVMNAWNETMGEMAALVFFVKSIQSYELQVQIVDVWGSVAASDIVQVTMPNSSSNLNGFQAVAVPFGPDSSWTIASSVNTTTPFFDWAGVAEIRFTMPTISQQIGVWFDGFFAIVKSLVVEDLQPDATPRRTQTLNQSGIFSWADAHNYGQSQLESLMQPQRYYKVTNIGRNDIVTGRTFRCKPHPRRPSATTLLHRLWLERISQSRRLRFVRCQICGVLMHPAIYD